jgi:hypothetical protein
MTLRLLFYSLLSVPSFSSFGQINLLNPRVCHDKIGYLKCYYDSSYRLEFDHGNFTGFSTPDSNLNYSDADKRLTFLSIYPNGVPKDTVQIKLLRHSIIITNGSLKKEITSLPTTATSLNDFHIGTYTVNNKARGLTFWAGSNRCVEVEVWPWEQGWQWDITVRQLNQTFKIKYNGFQKNGVESIYLRDDSLRKGMAASMTFKSLKKLVWLRSLYIDTITVHGKTVAKGMRTDNPYYYHYKKSGKIDKGKSVGEIKVCACN